MLSKNITKVLFCILLLALLGHFTLITIYNSPFKIKNKHINEASTQYAYPLFHQAWDVFTPLLSYKRSIYIKSNISSNNSKWIKVFPYSSDQISNYKENVNLTFHTLTSHLASVFPKNKKAMVIDQNNPQLLCFITAVKNDFKINFKPIKNEKMEVVFINELSSDSCYYYFIKNIEVND